MTSQPPLIVLLTVNEHETHAVFDAFLPAGQAPQLCARGGVDYFELGQHGGNRVLMSISEMGAGGIGAAAQRAQDAINHWQPQALIAVGIAFGMDESKQKIGDVLVSSQLQEYELGRLNQDGSLTPRGDKPGAAHRLLNRVRSVNTIQQRLPGGWPKLRIGLLLSGQKLVDNLDYRNSLQALFSEAIGGEMEGSGLYASAGRSKVDWLVVKAICDWGHDKNQGKKEEWQQQAAANAARVVLEMLRAPGLYQEQEGSAQQVAHAAPLVTAAPPASAPNPPSPAPAPIPASTPAPCPSWALQRKGDHVLLPVPWGAPQWLPMPLDDNFPQVLCQADTPFPKVGGLQISSFVLKRDEVGLLAEMTLSRVLTQAFRYIRPGAFLMGSSADEADRQDNETQHWVSISQGFWLADTAFTQAWWQALMGNNPSHFNQANGGGPEHPVENVSWLDVQACVRKLAALLPACLPSLPTEAEWEYACRAGSQTAFSFGDNIHPGVVNYEGNHPYKNAAKGLYRQKTVPVKDLPANGWGLYQMHGNVWEWCADGYVENLGQGLVEDPGLAQALAPKLDEEGWRVLRGGSWRVYALNARAADRTGYWPDWLNDGIGWRVALRSRQP
ncbi:SUMF1/EgtB/PvdO family nonheme iron enzyme [Massilia sp. W12]|uniref:SUMF1/EgtB/PvdO family nonheme iron enzyme n=1 Tax=Massilia sp. W12 TaxID=3126507 RepID=UPI0030D2C891